MSSPVLDFAKLLAEIPSPNGAAVDPAAPKAPTGVDLRADRTPPSLYDQIRETRKAARTAEDAPGDDANRPDWKPVIEHGTRALTEKTKDLEVAAYLIEALPRVHGFAGLRDGLRLARELIEKYWESLYPSPDDDALAEAREADALAQARGEPPRAQARAVLTARVESLAQVLRCEGRVTLTVPLAKLPLTEAESPVGRLSLDHYQKALKLNEVTDPKARQKLLDQGAVSIDTFRQTAAASSAEFYNGLAADLKGCSEELDKLSKVLDARCKDHRDLSPGTSTLQDQLTACLKVIYDVAKEKLTAAAPPTDDKPAAAPKAGSPAESLDVIRDREDAFRVLSKVADFFKRTEPHSVVSYALEQVVRWGRMPLPDLLSELIPDDSPRKNLFQRVGIKPAEPAKTDKK